MDEEDEGMEGRVKQGTMRTPGSGAVPPPGGASGPKSHSLRIVEGVLIVEKADGTVVVRVPKGEWEHLDASVAMARAASPGDSSRPASHSLRIVDGELIVEKLDGTLVARISKGDWAHKNGATCVKCVGNVKPPGTPALIPCCRES